MTRLLLLLAVVCVSGCVKVEDGTCEFVTTDYKETEVDGKFYVSGKLIPDVEDPDCALMTAAGGMEGEG